MSELKQNTKARIAVVGGGISGIACLWGLRETEHQVHIYDADKQLGGHAHSYTIKKNGNAVTVDTGFIAMQDDCYRMLLFHLFHLPLDNYIIIDH